MSETTNEATTETAGETSADSENEATSTEATSEEVDWKAKFEAQQKIARDLEKKVKGEAGSLKQQLDALQAKLEGKEAEFTAAQEAQRVKDEALSFATDLIKKAELRAAAKGKVSDDMLDALPSLVDVSSLDVSDDGMVDAAQIASAIDDLINKRPSLAAQGSRKFQGSADGGARNDASKVSQLTRADLTRMTPEQINDARKAGRLSDLLGGAK